MKSLKRQFVVNVSGIPGTWRQSTGGGMTSEVTKDYDGGALYPTVLGSLPEAEDIVLTRTFEPDRDLPIIEGMRNMVGRGFYTITKTATDANLVRIGKPLTYRGVLKAVSHPESDANSSDVSDFVLTFSHNGFVS
jgi:hypothetical protein